MPEDEPQLDVSVAEGPPRRTVPKTPTPFSLDTLAAVLPKGAAKVNTGMLLTGAHVDIANKYKKKAFRALIWERKKTLLF